MHLNIRFEISQYLRRFKLFLSAFFLFFEETLKTLNKKMLIIIGCFSIFRSNDFSEIWNEPNTESLSIGHVTKIKVCPFRFRRPRLFERIAMSLKKKFGRGDSKDFLMLKFHGIQ